MREPTPDWRERLLVGLMIAATAIYAVLVLVQVMAAFRRTGGRPSTATLACGTLSASRDPCAPGRPDPGLQGSNQPLTALPYPALEGGGSE